MMKKSIVPAIISAILILTMVTGCAQSPQAESQPVIPLTEEPPPTTQSEIGPVTSPTEELPQATLSDIFLTVDQPVDGDIVNVSEVILTGSTDAGAVVSANGEIAIVDARGNFAVAIILEDGPNIIEVIASDEEGNVARVSLVITLERGE